MVQWANCMRVKMLNSSDDQPCYNNLYSPIPSSMFGSDYCIMFWSFLEQAALIGHVSPSMLRHVELQINTPISLPLALVSVWERAEAEDSSRSGKPRAEAEDDKNMCDNPNCLSDPNDVSYKLSDCSRCRCVKYCSRACQKLMWSSHKTTCIDVY